ncbi:DUF4136 domain-containing protein [Dawidia soli]|uniref:DUF4136 domain-containing protein n=1 Tax=Dawidia soli TaxID=2782352 RepID=A0AAP2D6V9_9BACT|nr:DUF4136 domain-containing protein [Dawidia soli]MBT1686476.1 DUF4136 domain-containing protein [Dawidia soli]
MKYLVSLLPSLLLLACGPSITTYTDHDPAYDVSGFTTFGWSDKTDVEAGKNPLYYNELNDKRIKGAVEKELTSRGYIHSETHPDRLLHYHIVVDDESVLAPEPYGYFYGPYWMRARMHVYAYREGTLIIDMMDPQTKSLVWRSWATATLDMISKDKVDDVIARAVGKMFKGFPRMQQNMPATAEVSRRNAPGD